MNINNNPLRNQKSTRPPTPQELEAMRATRDQVRSAELSRQEVINRRLENARAEAKQAETRDRIEISIEARRRTEAAQADKATRRETIQRMKAAYKAGELGIESRRRAAAERMLGQDKG